MRRVVIAGLSVAVVVVAVALAWTWLGGDEEPPSVEELKSGVGRVETLNCDGTPFTVDGRAISGSGFLVGSQVVMTAEHGMWVGLDEPACKMRVRFGGEPYAVTGVRAWSDRAGTDLLERRGIDLATLALDRPVDGHVFRIAQDGAPVGTRVATLGYPLGGPLTLTRGRISKNVIDYEVPSIAAKLDIEGGNSGGPIFNDQGEVLSVVSRIVISGSLTADKSNRSGGVNLPRWWGEERSTGSLRHVSRRRPARLRERLRADREGRHSAAAEVEARPIVDCGSMDFRRVPSLPPYVFAVTEQLKLELRRAGDDVIDLGFGNPDLASPPAVVEKLIEAAAKPHNHRYSASRGIPKLRKAICDLYRDRFGVELDPETQAVATIGAKEGLAHLMWVLVQPGDAAVVPAPAYPIHLFAPVLAGASVIQVELGGSNDDLYDRLADAFTHSRPRPRVLIVSFPHNPTTRVVDLGFMERLVALARENEALVVHDFAYADVYFDGYKPPSILQVPGAEEVAVETYSLTKSFSMAGWRVGFALGNAPALAALARLKSYLDYGTFQPIQIASIVALNEERDYPGEACEIYRKRRNVLCDGLARVGWQVERPLGTMFVWAPIPEPYRDLGSLEFAVKLTREAKVAVSPGVGFGPGGEGFVRFALVENEQRIAQAVRGIRRALPELAATATR